eukprot:432455_1
MSSDLATRPFQASLGLIVPRAQMIPHSEERQRQLRASLQVRSWILMRQSVFVKYLERDGKDSPMWDPKRFGGNSEKAAKNLGEFMRLLCRKISKVSEIKAWQHIEWERIEIELPRPVMVLKKGHTTHKFVFFTLVTMTCPNMYQKDLLNLYLTSITSVIKNGRTIPVGCDACVTGVLKTDTHDVEPLAPDQRSILSFGRTQDADRTSVRSVDSRRRLSRHSYKNLITHQRRRSVSFPVRANKLPALSARHMADCDYNHLPMIDAPVPAISTSRRKRHVAKDRSRPRTPIDIRTPIDAGTPIRTLPSVNSQILESSIPADKRHVKYIFYDETFVRCNSQ